MNQSLKNSIALICFFSLISVLLLRVFKLLCLEGAPSGAWQDHLSLPCHLVQPRPQIHGDTWSQDRDGYFVKESRFLSERNILSRCTWALLFLQALAIANYIINLFMWMICLMYITHFYFFLFVHWGSCIWCLHSPSEPCVWRCNSMSLSGSKPIQLLFWMLTG